LQLTDPASVAKAYETAQRAPTNDQAAARFGAGK
jgi:hypothetical protein